MNITPHIVVGAVCGLYCRHPVVAFSAGVGTHFLLDLIPHHDQETYFDQRKHYCKAFCIAVLDVVLGIIFTLFLLRVQKSEFYQLGVIGGIGGAFPDLVDNLCLRFLFPYLGRMRLIRWLSQFHDKCHTNTPRHRWILGLLTQILAFILGSAALAYS